MKKLLKGKLILPITLLISVIISSGIGYGVGSITSEGVSYTKSDGTTVSVKQALDDVINKSLSQINTLKSEKAELTTFKNNIISGLEKGEAGYLADKVSVGDYVAYDAGSWTSSAAKPTSQGQFGGYTSGQNKANSVSWCMDSSEITTTLKGWRVLKVDSSTKTVTLIHAGQPECYYHGTDPGSSVTNLNNRANTYLNSSYADSAHMLNKDEALAITGNREETGNNLRTTGAYYWLATAYNTVILWRVGHTGYVHNCDSNLSYGVRPVIVLKSKILTTGKGTDYVGQEAWTLVKP